MIVQEKTRFVRIRKWPDLRVDSHYDGEGRNWLTATGGGLYWGCCWSSYDCPVGSVPIGFGDLCLEKVPVDYIPPVTVRRCKAHGSVDCFDCTNAVQSTQTDPQFEMVEVINGHE